MAHEKRYSSRGRRGERETTESVSRANPRTTGSLISSSRGSYLPCQIFFANRVTQNEQWTDGRTTKIAWAHQETDCARIPPVIVSAARQALRRQAHARSLGAPNLCESSTSSSPLPPPRSLSRSLPSLPSLSPARPTIGRRCRRRPLHLRRVLLCRCMELRTDRTEWTLTDRAAPLLRPLWHTVDSSSLIPRYCSKQQERN